METQEKGVDLAFQQSDYFTETFNKQVTGKCGTICKIQQTSVN